MTSSTLTGLALMKYKPGAGGAGLQSVEVGPPLPGQALVKIAAAGICGTDLHILDDEWPVKAPVVVGHELSGVVLAVGSETDNSWIGKPVVSEVFYGSDGTCESCLEGRRNLCPDRESLGSHADGAFGPAVLVPIRNLHALPASIDLVEAALLEPLACVAGALCDPAIINPGDRVLVTGPGAIGLLAAQVAQAAGGEVLMMGRESDQRRLDVAQQLGLLTATQLDPEDSFEVVIECTGAGSAANACLAAAKRRGRYVQMGLFAQPVPVDMNTVCLKELTITSGFGATPSGFRRAIRLASDGSVKLAELITRTAPLSEWESVFAASRKGDGVKFLFTPNR